MAETKVTAVIDGSVSTFHQLEDGTNEEEVRPPADHAPYRRAPQDHSSLEQQQDISLPSTDASSGDGNKVLPPLPYDTCERSHPDQPGPIVDPVYSAVNTLCERPQAISVAQEPLVKTDMAFNQLASAPLYGTSAAHDCVCRVSDESRLCANDNAPPEVPGTRYFTDRPPAHGVAPGTITPSVITNNPASHSHHHPCYSDPAVPPVALLLLGNAGAGKSTLLTQLGGTKFGSGAKFRQGFTKDVSEQDVDIAGQSVRLIDVPGLFEPSDKETQFNATQLTKALRHQNYNYRLYFVLKADNRGPGDNEMVMMSKISECVRKADGSKMSFGVIVNQIRTADVHSMYEQEMVSDRFQAVFAGLDIPGFTFDIKIDSVIMLPYDEVGLMQDRFRDIIAQEILKHQASAITLEKDISFCNNDLKRYHAGILGAASGAISTPLAPSGTSMHGGSSQAVPSQSSTKPKTDIFTGFIKVVAEPDKKFIKLWQKAAQAAVIKNLHRPAK